MFSTLTKINGYSPIKALFLKEFWDNKRAILITPMVVTGLFIVFSLIALINGSGMMIDGAQLTEHLANAQNIDKHSTSIITGIIIFSPMILFISVAFSMIFTALSVLFDERKNKSILFWKSMPVSDTQEVLVKLATVIFIIPLVAIPFVLIIQAVTTLIIGALIAVNSDYNIWDFVFLNINYLTIMVGDIVPAFVVILWALPIFTWFMLVSSFSKRSPFLLAFIVPVLIMIAESIFFRSSLLQQAIASRFIYLEKYAGRYDIDDGFTLDRVTSLLSSFSEPNFWMGLVAAALMIVGCIQLRKRNMIT